MGHVGRMRRAINAEKPRDAKVFDMAAHQRSHDEFSGKTIAVGIPAHDKVDFLFAFDLANLMAFTAAAMPDDVSLVLVAMPGTYVHSARQDIADTVVKNGYDFLFWLDADMRFPPDTLVRLLQRRKDIVGINYAMRGIPSRFVAIKKIGWDGAKSERLVTNAESRQGCEEVEGIGFGAVLMKVDVLRSLPDPKKSPWFFFEWLPELGQQVGEDIWFCRLVREHGHKIYVDHELSLECAHIGQWEYRCEHVQPEEY